MGRSISGKHYAIGVWTRIGVFAVVTIGFPLFVYGMITLLGASKVGGASGALALVLGLYLKPVIYLALTFSMLRISLRRARTLNLPALIGICVPLFFFADLGFGMTFGSFWAVGFSLGILHMPVPASLIAGVVTTLTLGFLHEFEETWSPKLATLYTVWKVLLFTLLGFGLLGILPQLAIWFFPGSAHVIVSALQILGYLRSAWIYPHVLLIAFMVVSSALVAASRERPHDVQRPPSRRVPTGPAGNQAPLFGPRNAR
ncbi:hypothetical protein [Neorhizobium alkalisoli]|uniref:Uncharacterized protein n=1 Tax=Neorhizobium alkalisoli TaxID=528178 RepID=A0A561QRL4_9HYPH|nr:hypothetical protein [Neorhizobium alkalisoli]TWF53038.1 hypothetical protein FHW37_104309 [Neorhizobium alkalisoli]